MAFNNDQNEPKVPSSNVDNRETSNLLPRYYRTKGNKKFLQGTLDQLTQPGTVKKIAGYVGRESAKATTSKDLFLAAADTVRQDYQLEPAAVVKDYLGNTTFFKDYIDHINHISIADGIVDNHSRVNEQEFYSWNPHIDWDKFVNFQQYYWMPFGPESVTVNGQQKSIVSEFTVRTVDEEDNVAYLFDPEGPAEGLVRNPTLTLYRGQTYVFDIKSPGHPFSIKTDRTEGTTDRYYTGVSSVGVETGTITFTVPLNAPDVLFYVSENAVDTGGVFHVLDITENTFLNVETDLLGKKNYTIPAGIGAGTKLSNGMKLKFAGQILPEQYSSGYWYVEGVGTAIKLISDRDLEIRSTYVEESSLLFDDLPFDQVPFSETGTFPSRPDYVTINRSSVDNNPWSRYNRWFHKDIIETSARANGNTPEFDQATRATRPIIEFVPNIKLHNYGVIAKKGVDLIDNFTKDVFSTIEGSLGYNIDGVDLVEGMRVLFNADSDILVNNKIYKVNFVQVQSAGRLINFAPQTAITLETSTVKFTTEHGLTSGNRVTYLQNGNEIIAGLTNRQVYYVRAVDPFTIALYSNKELTKQAVLSTLPEGTHSFEFYSGTRRQITLVEEPDTNPTEYETVSIRFGTNDIVVPGSITGNKGQNYWFNGTTWALCQVKNNVNTPPLFDIFDDNGVSYSDLTIYEGSNFNGNKIFSYKVGTGSTDSVLGFPLTYKNINNVGDIVFDFNLLTESCSYKVGLTLSTKTTNTGYLKLSQSLETYRFENGWITNQSPSVQPIVRVFRGTESIPDSADTSLPYVGNNSVVYLYDTSNAKWIPGKFPIDVFSDQTDLEDLEVRVYVNGRRVNKDTYEVISGTPYSTVIFYTDIVISDNVTLKCFAKQKKNNNGHYEMPINLQNNPLNEDIAEFTLGQVVDHVDTIIENISGFSGTYPGNNNLRDIGKLSEFGTRFVQHSGPLNLALYHFGSKNSNLIKAMDQARNDYGQFKRAFLIAATNSGIDTDAKRHVDYVLQEMVKDKPKSRAYFLSDMFGFTASNKIDISVLDSRIKVYPLSKPFSLKSPSNKSVNIYLNGEQLTHGRDYSFGAEEFFTINDTIELAENDLIEVYEYESTDGCFCPPTPSKLGLYPAYEPKIYIDNSYLEPTKVIQGHDGSIVLAFDDFRDELILELETRIFNNIKTTYDPEIFDIYNYIPGYSRTTDYSVSEFNEILSKYFFQWTQNIPQDYTKQDSSYDRTNPFTWNYRNNYTSDDIATPAAWRGIYRWLFDTTVPHIKPWEALGFSIKPTWWESVYGPAPYTSDNKILWNDLRDGRIREPGVPVRLDSKFARPILTSNLPVDETGNLVSPYDAGFAQGYIPIGDSGYYVFGDEYTVEAAWRKSSYYPFAILQTMLLMKPNDVLGRGFDRSRIVKNATGQLIYKDTGLRIRLSDVVIPSTAITAPNLRTYACGLISYVADYLTNERTDRIEQYQFELSNLTNNIATRLGGFTSKPKYKLLLDSKNPNSSGGVFVPDENYFIDLNVSSATKKIVYSGVIITKFADGFEIRGYNFENPYFKYYSARVDDRVIRIGGISESYTTWTPGRTYVAGKIVLTSDTYYRVLVNHVAGDEFNKSYYAKLPALPLVGGTEAMLKKYWDTSEVNRIAYGTKFETIQEVVDFLQGYGAYLEEQGFVFDDFNNTLAEISNWETTVKEFLFWTSQGWDVGSVISLSPSADRLIFRNPNAVVDNIVDPYYGYTVYKVDGQKLDPEFIQVYRGGNEFVLEPYNTNFGVYGVTLHLVQKEHVAIIDNTTLFNDTIYDKPAGYRQEKIKVLGYVTTNWNGGFEIPGFIYDRAVINSWEPWTDYNLGDIIKYKEFYYTAKSFLPGVETFDSTDWVLLETKPKAELLPNWDYRAEQFTDFYDLDTDNFDAEQQKIAQHLTGYQKRQYLENIINNDVSQYKFYQGMIAEKGTQNVLNKLFDVLSADDKESLTFDEEWAFRVGEYGALDTFEEVEFILDESQFKVNPQPLEIVDYIDTSKTDLVYRQRPSDVYVKPEGLTKDIWAKKRTTPYLRTPGYVRKEDVRINLDKISDLVTADISNFIEGDYVWTAFEGISWNIYRLTQSEYKINNVTAANGTITLECNKIVNYAVGTVIGIENSDKLKGFYTVTGTSLNKIFVSGSPVGFNEFNDKDTILFYVLTSQRIKNIDDANSIIPNPMKDGELLWTDNAASGDWAVFKNSSVFTSAEVLNSVPKSNSNFGATVAVSADGNICAVANSEYVTLYQKSSTSNEWRPQQRIEVTGSDPIIKLSSDAFILVVAYANSRVETYQRQPSGTYLGLSFSETLPELITNIALGKQSDEIILAVSSTDSVYLYKNNGIAWNTLQTELTGTGNFGFDIAIDETTLTLVVSAPADTGGKVNVYAYNGTSYSLTQELLNPSIGDSLVKFGTSVAISSNGNYIAIGAPYQNSSTTLDVGCVHVYKFNGTSYDKVQTINSRYNETNEQFGSTVEFMNGSDTLVVYSQFSDFTSIQQIDNGSTIFDNNSLKFIDGVTDISRVDVYDRYNTTFVYGETLQPMGTGIGYGKQLAVGSNTILVAASIADTDGLIDSGTVYSYVKPAATASWTKLHSQSYSVDISTIKKAYLYDKTTNKIIKYLDVVDPMQNKIPGPADQEIKFKSYYDPATYSLGTNAVAADEGMAWTNEYVGMLWWDLSKARFLNNETGDVVYKTNTWNKLYDTASIDIYEWVESKVLPAVWNTQLTTEAGIATGVSGTTKYGNEIYSVKKKYDTVSKTFTNTYYFWVKNKTTIPNIEGRQLSAANVSQLIADPVGYGYPCLALIDSNSVSFVNCENYLNSARSVLSLQYWTSDARNSNYHSQWKILSTNRNTTIPAILEDKWFHSLVGKDDSDRLVPDVNLPMKHRYGVEYRPRQSMFVNRIEALKQYVERVNSVLKNVLVADTYDLSELNRSEPEPSVISGEWDFVVDTSQELRFIQTFLLATATVTTVLIDGRVTRIDINSPGYGYGKSRLVPGTTATWYGPLINIVGSGKGATARTIVDTYGRVIDTEVIDSGEGYDTSTTAYVRDIVALAKSDEETNTWALYTLNNGAWRRSKVQSYNVNNYWNYIDWYAAGYNQYVKIDFLLNNTYELVTTEIDIGSIVRIKNIGSGGWVLLEKYNNLATIDYTQNFKVIGRENGTIEFSDAIYNPIKGYDKFLLDSAGYDLYPTEDLRIILHAVKNNLLVDELKIDYLKLFFAGVRYALHEQTFTDWVLKTSFVKAMHNLGDLSQKVTYNSDNLEYFEEYIKEVKPYHTKIREYVSNYEKLEPSRSAVSDFDLLPVIDDNYKVSPLTVNISDEGEIVTPYTEIDTDPWLNWNNNVGFEITSIEVVDQGEGYSTRPIVEITGVQLPGGTPATANAYITNGKVNRIQLVTPGTRWIKAPTVTIKGGSLATTGTPARAVAIIGNSVIRSNLVKVKFDRIARTYQVANLVETETFDGTTTVTVSGSRTQFPLRWSPNIEIDKYTVMLKHPQTTEFAEVLKNEYSLKTVTTIVDGTTKYSGLLTFTTPPTANSVINVTYQKNFDHLSAVDRINFSYNPKSGQTGKDLSQLMTGIDYGGVNITGLGFGTEQGWDAQPWFSDVWDSVAPGYEDYNVTLAAPLSYNFRLPYVPEEGQQVNVYVSKFRKFITNSIANITALAEIDTNGDNVADAKILKITTTETYEGLEVLKIGQKITFSYNGQFEILVVRHIRSTTEFDVITPLDSTITSDWEIDTGSYDTAVRIDDPSYLTINQTNENALMTTFVGDGVINTIALPTTANLEITEIYPESFGDVVVFRKVDSDGSVAAKDDDYDTKLSGGDLAYSSATGFAPDDIILDGDGFITAMTSHAPEEIVPGQVMDTLAIKVYTRPAGGAPNILFKNYRGDGVSTDFIIGQYFQNSNAVIVKVDNLVKMKDTDYTIDFQNNLIKFAVAPVEKSDVNIISTNFASSTVLDLDYFVADGETSEYITRAPWLQKMNATVLVNGEIVTYEIFSTDNRYTDSLNESWRSRVGIKFEVAPVEGAIINYIIDQADIEQTASVVKAETISYIDMQDTYLLANKVGNSLPLEPNVLVKAGNTILRPPSYDYFTLSDSQLIYELKDSKYQDAGINSTDIKVYIDGELQQFGSDYNLRFGFSTPLYSLDNDTISLTGSDYSAQDLLQVVGGVTGVYGQPALLEVGSVIFSGTGATFTITKIGSTTSYNSANTVVNPVNAGLNYHVGDQITVYGNYLGGVASVNALTFNVLSVNATGGITAIDNATITGTSIVNAGIYAACPSKTTAGKGYISSHEIVSAGAYEVVPESPFILTGGTGTDATCTAEFIATQDDASYAVELKPSAYKESKTLVVGVTKNADYEFNNSNSITFNNVLSVNSVDIISFYNHNVLGIERTVDVFDQTPRLDIASPEYFEYSSKQGGEIKLRSTVSSGDFVWVIKNGELLINNLDYYLESDKQTIRLKSYLNEADVLQVMAFTNTVTTDSFGFMQFKDIMNRVHYKRLNAAKSTLLATALGQFDSEIVVTDPTVLDRPNPSANVPGIIEINGERIEYFIKDGMTLKQLRRGTLGTSIPTTHVSGSIVQSLGASETIPYKDEHTIIKVESDGVTSVVALPYVPAKNEVEVFVGGYRLKKNEYALYTNTAFPYSPQGDTVLPAEFIVNGGNLQLSTVPARGIEIVVVRKQGKLWNDSGIRLANSENTVANFVKAVEAIWPAPTLRE